MNREKNFETFLLIGVNNFTISIREKDNLEIIHEKKVNFKNESNKINYDKLEDFLNRNIFNIEKTFNYFIKNIYIILDHE